MHTFAAGSVLPGASIGSLVPRAVRGMGRTRAPASIVAMAGRKKRKEKSRRKENEGGSAPAPAAPAPAAPAQSPAAAPTPAPAAPAGRARDNEIDWAEIERNNEQARAAMGAPSTPAPAGDGLLERAFSADAKAGVKVLSEEVSPLATSIVKHQLGVSRNVTPPFLEHPR